MLNVTFRFSVFGKALGDQKHGLLFVSSVSRVLLFLFLQVLSRYVLLEA